MKKKCKKEGRSNKIMRKLSINASFRTSRPYWCRRTGESAFQFIELLKENSRKIWQILPLNWLAVIPSYQPYSSCRDELYISLDALAEEGLLKEHPKEFQERATRDYEAVRQYRRAFLKNCV